MTGASETDFNGLQKQLNDSLPTKNIFYAIRIDGNFSYVKTRSVPKQAKPYPLLAEVVKNQPIFEKKNVRGTIVGFFCPSYVKGINVPGFHFHFISDDRKFGGHLLDCSISKGEIKLDYTNEFAMNLPVTKDFMDTDLSGEKEQELKKVEK
jgi:acetolactate decarboxylase